MSGHSHYATIKRQKEVKDSAKGKIFSKLGKAISIAVKAGGGTDPEANYKLRMAIDAARSANMPKVNIDRAITKGSGEVDNIEEVAYEGFGPGGIAIIVQAATDNRNRTGQEIKNIFEKGGGNLAGPGSVSFNFEPKGFLLVQKENNLEEQMFKLIDCGAEDIEETGDGLEIFTNYNDLAKVKKEVEIAGLTIRSFSLVQKPKNLMQIQDGHTASKALALLEKFEDLDDVQEVYSNIDISPDIMTQVSS